MTLKKYLYLILFLLMPLAGMADEVTDEQYKAANAAIEAEATYHIFTFHDGTGEGSTKYFLTDDGWLTDEPDAAGSFRFHRIEGGDLFKSPGWQVDQYFTNPDCRNGQTEWMRHEGHIRTNPGLARENWEGQVWYKRGDTYAVRATNAPYDSWGATTYWNVVEDMEGDGLPNADYNLDAQFVWRLEKIADAPDPGELSIKDVQRLTNLPHVYIDTFNGRNINSKTNYVYARMWYVDEDDNVTFFDSLEIRGRGNATWGLDKKPYKLKFHDKQKLLGKGYAKAKKWTLLANHGDKTLIRNAVTSLMGDRLGLEFNPAAKFIDLTFNDRYDGTYQISDQVEVRPHRVNINEQDWPLTEESDITGGYLLEAISSDVSFYTDWGVPIRIHYPDVDEIEVEQKSYIQDFIKEFEYRLYADNFTDRDDGYRPYIDSTSLANWYLCTEISGNVDGFYSTYFYKEQQDDHLYWGPLWDYDIAYNNDNRDRENKGYNTLYQLMADVGYDNMRKWVRRMWEDPWFARLINRRFHEVVNDGLETYLNLQIDSLTKVLDESKELNYQRWDINRRNLREIVLYSSYNEYVKDLRYYIHEHLKFLKDAFAALAPDGSGDDPDIDPKVPDFPADSLSYYVISNLGTTTVFDINAETDDVVCNARNDESESQQWRIYPLANGYLYVVNRATGMALNDPTEGEPTAETLVGTQLNTVHGDSLNVRQQWDFVAQAGGHFNLISRFSQHAANLMNGDASDGTGVLSYTSNDRNATSNNRLWNIAAVGTVDPDAIEEIEGDIDYALAYDPSSGRLHFGADDMKALRFTVRLYDSSGRLQRTFCACDDTNVLGLPRGLYLITWEFEGRRCTVKFRL